jgi:hypothetical protein
MRRHVFVPGRSLPQVWFEWPAQSRQPLHPLFHREGESGVDRFRAKGQKCLNVTAPANQLLSISVKLALEVARGKMRES